VCLVGTRALRDFHAGLCASNLRQAGLETHAVNMPLEFERADMNALGIARHFEDARWRGRFCAELSPKLHADEHVGLPSVLGLRDPHTVWSDLEQRLGRRVFEVPSLPPSVPGMRMFEILRAALRRAGGRLVLGSEVIEAQRDGRRVTAVTAETSGRTRRYDASWFVLASGGFASGAIELDSRWEMHERVLGLSLDGVPAAGEPRFVPTYLTEQPLARVGVAVDSELRSRDVENVLVAGASLAGAVPWREGSGEGIALASGYAAAQVIGSQSAATTKAAA
jgi:glycerol-3-phosphate dehydrogenase subunit B